MAGEEPALPPVRVVASARRRRTVSARMSGGVLEVRVPASMPAAERARWVATMRQRVARRLRRSPAGDADLQARALSLNRRYFDGRLIWSSIGYAEQERRWGSCNPAAGTIRIASRVARLPGWVLDYLVVHELAHLAVPSHGPRFWALVGRYPLTERARGYLLALDGGGAGEPAGGDPAVGESPIHPAG